MTQQEDGKQLFKGELGFNAKREKSVSNLFGKMSNDLTASVEKSPESEEVIPKPQVITERMASEIQAYSDDVSKSVENKNRNRSVEEARIQNAQKRINGTTVYLSINEKYEVRDLKNKLTRFGVELGYKEMILYALEQFQGKKLEDVASIVERIAKTSRS